MKKELFFALALSMASSTVALAQSSSSSDSSSYPSSPSSDPSMGSSNTGDTGSMGDASKKDTTGRGAGASGAVSNPQATKLENQFNRLDTNHQGYLTPSEAAKDSDLSQNFNQADADKDGKVTLSEYVKYEETKMGASGTGGTEQSETGKKNVQR